jgi:hypothetical protein
MKIHGVPCNTVVQEGHTRGTIIQLGEIAASVSATLSNSKTITANARNTSLYPNWHGIINFAGGLHTFIGQIVRFREATGKNPLHSTTET